MNKNTATTSVLDGNLFFTKPEIPRAMTKIERIGLQVVINHICELQCAERLRRRPRSSVGNLKYCHHTPEVPCTYRDAQYSYRNPSIPILELVYSFIKHRCSMKTTM